MAIRRQELSRMQSFESHALAHQFECLSAKVIMADLDRKEDLLLLLKLEEKLGLDGKNSKTPVLYCRNKLIYGNDALKAMRKGLALRFIVQAFFLVGVAVTVLESICTGQVYLPTLALLAEHGIGGKVEVVDASCRL